MWYKSISCLYTVLLTTDQLRTIGIRRELKSHISVPQKHKTCRGVPLHICQHAYYVEYGKAHLRQIVGKLKYLGHQISMYQ